MNEQNRSNKQSNGDDKRSICSACGQQFNCGAMSGAARCWCMERPSGLFAPVAGAGCYCPACLEKRISEQPFRAA
jgi:hypothetical protein